MPVDREIHFGYPNAERAFEFAKRVFIMHGIRVCAWNPELFVSDLLYYKIITEILVN